jgi:hypothetical protein
MVIVKRITVGLSGLAIAGILIVGCEKFDGPEPYLNKRLEQNKLLFISAPDSASAGGEVLGEIPLGDTLDKLLISDAAVQAIVNTTVVDSTGKSTIIKETMTLDIATVGKIIFQ